MTRKGDDLKALVAVCREAGLVHYEGPVPGWDSDIAVKFILGPAPVVAAPVDPTKKPAKPAPKSYEELQRELDAAVGVHINLHGGLT